MTRNSIINAPSKFDLCFAFFDRPDPEQYPDSRRPVTFTIEGPSCLFTWRKIEVVINNITWEDGSGESWNFEGYCKTNVGQPKNRTAKVKGWFQTSDRKGWIDIDAPAKGNTGKTVSQVDPGFRDAIDKIAAERR